MYVPVRAIVATMAIATVGAAHDGDSACTHGHSPHQTAVLQSVSAYGGLAGAVEVGGHDHAGGGSCVTPAGRVRMQEAMRAYAQRFGPFESSPHTRGGVPPYPIHPVGAREWQDLIMYNYVDLDLSEGSVQDWNCGGYTYDGHNGIDALISTFDHQLVGVPVTAVLDGTITYVHDGEPDQNTEWDPDSVSNSVCIHHGGDLYTWYYHLKNGSVSVEMYQEVRAGEQIGLVASSGYSSWPHLHFETRRYTGDAPDDWDGPEGTTVEPYAGSCNPGGSMWANQVGIPSGATCRQFGTTTTNLDEFFASGVYQWRPPLSGAITTNHAQLWMWTQATDIGPFSTFQMRFYDPSGSLNYDSGTLWLNFSWDTYRMGTFWFSWDLPGLHSSPGTWTVDVVVNGDPYINFPLEVLDSGETHPNRIPEHISADIGPIDATADDLLTCRVDSSAVADLDWDLVRYRYTWRIGDRVLRDVVSAGRADHLPRVEGCDGAVIKCTVVPSDGMDQGAPVIAAIRLAGNSAVDINCDGSIDIGDLLIILAEFGPCSLCGGDFDLDGDVDINDILMLLSNWE